jgi:diaminohydroxyphosphoribosylaminopyrimidine deaminase/5-amino-6-(5-phosphoribosylamino)uracil reductase
VDELLVYTAPVLLGDALGMVRMDALQSLAQAQRFEFIDTTLVAPDVRLRARHTENWKLLLRALQP